MLTILLFLTSLIGVAPQEGLTIMPNPPIEGKELKIVGQSKKLIIEVAVYICEEIVGEVGIGVGGKVNHTVTMPENTAGLPVVIEMYAYDPDNPSDYTYMTITRIIQMDE